MLNPVQAGVEEHRRPRLSFSQMVFWFLAAGVPLAGLGAAAILWESAASMDAAVRAYRAAVPCQPGATSSATCYTLIPGTLVNYSISRGKTGDTTTMTVKTADGIRSTWARTSWAQEDLLRDGAAVQVQFFEGKLVGVYIGDRGIATRDSPLSQQQDTKDGALLVALFGLAVSGAMIFTRFRTRKLAPPLGAGGILRPSSMPSSVPEPSAPAPAVLSLPMTLRPHPMPTGRPWWIGLIVVAFAVPSLLLRLRTPTTMAAVVLVVTGGAMVAAVILHWLYRNRRMLVIDDFAVRRVNLWGASKLVPRSDIAGIAFPVVLSYNAWVADEPRLVLLDGTGRCLLRLSHYYSTDNEARQLASALRVPTDSRLSRSMTANQLRRLVPGAAGWMEAHPFLTAFALAPPLLIGVGLLVWTLNGFK